MKHLSISPGPSAGLVSLAELWSGLTAGTFVVIAIWHSPTECYVKLRRRGQTGESTQLGVRERAILERIFRGESQKRIAIELTVAPSTIASLGRDSLLAMGVRAPASRVPMMLVLAAHAATGTRLPPALLVRTTDCDDGDFIAVATRPDSELERLLSAAEVEVSRRLVEGQTHAEIARSRQRSKRTVANQLASAFRKLKVSSRGELLSKLVREAQDVPTVMQ
jgi:DNA-binding NarL/FixJ family response regulator